MNANLKLLGAALAGVAICTVGDEALAFDASPAYVALKAGRDKSSNWRSYVVEGLPN